ncbi:MAG TPA: hypothetical protein VL328_12710 [Gemmatimonadaceae bacterium]|nr:hypothetical protein [Gemmatimonadaceae bacterium]
MTRAAARAATMATALAATIAALSVPRAACAQRERIPIAPELRADFLGGRRSSVQGAAGLEIPAGWYVRVGVLAGVGASFREGEPTRAAGRVDVLARFLLDPFRQSRWGFSAGAGMSLRAEEGDRVRPRLLLALDLEGPRSKRGPATAVQVGLGGGARVGVGVRWGRGAR